MLKTLKYKKKCTKLRAGARSHANLEHFRKNQIKQKIKQNKHNLKKKKNTQNVLYKMFAFLWIWLK